MNFPVFELLPITKELQYKIITINDMKHIDEHVFASSQNEELMF